MDQKEYLSIKEFAGAAGVSTQSVYKRLATSLQPYVKEVANQRMLNIRALRRLAPDGCFSFYIKKTASAAVNKRKIYERIFKYILTQQISHDILHLEPVYTS